ncbi:MAG: hypothetical protein ACK4HB_08460, partial [Candidatus Bipolaricaulia bacterium]
GLKVTSQVIFCTNLWYCDWAAGGLANPALLPPVVAHFLSFSGAVGPLSVAATAVFDGGLFGDFAELDVDMSVTVGAATFMISTVLLPDMLGGLGVSMSFKF